jgi:hypothetical protein
MISLTVNGLGCSMRWVILSSFKSFSSTV